MPTANTQVTSEGLAKLRNIIEEKLDRKMCTPADFIFLSDIIARNVKMAVSATTLKRVWGYISDKGEEYLPAHYTLSALTKLLGFRDYETFISAPDPMKVESNLFFAESIDMSTLSADDVLLVSWTPDRQCRLKYLGNNWFEVIEARNSKIRVGDQVLCTSLTQSAPLYFDVVKRDGSLPMSYIAGARNGVRIVIEPTIPKHEI